MEGKVFLHLPAVGVSWGAEHWELFAICLSVRQEFPPDCRTRSRKVQWCVVKSHHVCLCLGISDAARIRRQAPFQLPCSSLSAWRSTLHVLHIGRRRTAAIRAKNITARANSTHEPSSQLCFRQKRILQNFAPRLWSLAWRPRWAWMDSVEASKRKTCWVSV